MPDKTSCSSHAPAQNPRLPYNAVFMVAGLKPQSVCQAFFISLVFHASSTKLGKRGMIISHRECLFTNTVYYQICPEVKPVYR